jgi:hypothetical protein
MLQIRVIARKPFFLFNNNLKPDKGTNPFNKRLLVSNRYITMGVFQGKVQILLKVFFLLGAS